MCEPVIMATLAVASTAAGIVGQVKAAKHHEATIRDQLAVSTDEINDKSTAAINDRQRAARREQARIKVAAGQAGLQLGGSIDMLLKDSLMQAGLDEERVNDNREAELRNVRSEANSMLSRVQRPTVLGAGLQLASAGMSGYAAGESLKVSRQNANQDAGRG